MLRDNVGDLVAFMAVAQAGSFTRAATELGISQPALSHAIRQLEKRLGLRLLNGTTRSVSTTEAGEKLLRTITPHFDGIAAGVSELTEMREKPAGIVRITTGDHQAEAILMPTIAQLLPIYPDLSVEISVDLGFVDIVAERFDAGIRLGETVGHDMVALRIGPDMRMAVVGSPSYFAGKSLPGTPHNLSAHNCIGLRFSRESGVGLWEFEKQGRPVNVRIEGQFVVNTLALVLSGALRGSGLAYLPEDYVSAHLESGELVRALTDWCEPFPGYHLYYPSRRQQTAAFRVVVEALRPRV